MKVMHVLAVLLAALALVPRAALGSEVLHPTGLLYEDPRTVPGLTEVIDPYPTEVGPDAVQTDALISVNMTGIPPVGDQGSQGSCVGWAMGYYHKTHTEWLEHGWNVGNTAYQMSPAFLYNQMNGGVDGGAYYSDAMQIICEQGDCSWSDMPYNQLDWWTWPSESAYSHAIPLRGGTANYIDVSNNTGLTAVKNRVNAGLTTVLGIYVWGNFDNINTYDTTYCVSQVTGVNRGGHAVTIVGYDDAKVTADGVGAFRLVNSWGVFWGNAGYWWMSYQAVMSGVTSQQWAYFVTDYPTVGYTPTLLGRVRITHNDREAMGIRLGVGDCNGVVFWSKDFRTWRWNGGTDRPFPANNIVFDMTGGEGFISGGQTDSGFVRCSDDESDGVTGTISYFSLQDLTLAVSGVSTDPPVAIPDFLTPAYAAVRLLLPLVDAGVTSIVSPPANVDSGIPVVPQAWVQNFGIAPASFSVTFNIPGYYGNTQPVNNLGAGLSLLVPFAPWTPTTRGPHGYECHTVLTGDMNSTNDTLAGTVTVDVRDIGVTQIIAPPAVLDSGVPVVPQSVIQNFGTIAATCWTKFIIYGPTDQAYEESLWVSINAGASQSLVFPGWTAEPPGSYTMESYTTWTTDMVRSNDTTDGAFVVNAPVRDVGVVSIASPGGEYPAGSAVTPVASWFNYGNVSVNLEAWMMLYDPSAAQVYAEMVPVNGLPPGGAATDIPFPAVVLPTIGTWTARCSTRVLGDANAVNDTLSKPFTVASRWEEIGCVPTGPSEQPVGHGGWLAHNSYDNLLYVGKGNKTADCYAYNADNNTWSQLKPLPFERHPMWARKPPSRGAQGVADGGNYVYATQGNNTLGFWRYVIDVDSWEVLTDVPLGVSRKKVKGGTDMAYVVRNDTGYVYLLKGYKTEFYRYNTVSGSWEGKADAPTGDRAKWDKGSWLLAEDQAASVIYAHKAKYHEFYTYFVDVDTWSSDTTLIGMPFVGMSGRRKKSKDGGSAAWYAGDIYALKGGNTQEFWRYGVLTEAWDELDTMPSMGYSGKKKRVKYGGDIAQVNGRLFALKGNKTCEFWRYSPAPGPMQPPAPEAPRAGVMARPAAFTPAGCLTVMPNPLAQGKATVCYSLERPGPGVISVSDIAGRVVLRQTATLEREGSTVLDLAGLPAGVYLVHLGCGRQALTRKLVVQ